uniref:Uncharacterized protein n=1 Tax=Panagrolaimus sp. ES5 TaxID=591445 RepID=A0AC34GRP5_9BILA
MSSRRHSELSYSSNMNLKDKGDENSTPVAIDINTPREKHVPMKKTRVSDTPLSSRQQNLALKGDKNHEETFVEPSFVAAPPAAESKLLMDITQESGTFNNEEKVAASVQQSSSSTSAQRTQSAQKSVSFQIVKHLEETPVEQSFVVAPPAAKSESLMDVTQESEISYDEEKLDASLQQSTSAQRTQSADISYLGGSMVSFLEEEMQIYAEEQCKCVRFQSVIKEYTAIREKFDAKPRGESVNTTMKNEASFNQLAEEEIFYLNEELAKTKMEVEEYKIKADIAKKEADDYQFVLDEEKRRAKNRLADLQKENFALSDELEALKFGGGDAFQQENDATKELQEQILQLNEQYLKANAEVEEYKLQAKNAQQEAENLRHFMKVQKDSINSCIGEALQHKNAEIESLKADMGDTEKMKKQLVRLEEKAKMFDEVVKRGSEVEEIYKELKAKMVSMKNAHADLQSQNDVMVNSLESEIAVLGNEKSNLQKALNDKDDELNQLKSSGEKEKAEMQEQIAFLSDQLSKVTLEVEEYKIKTDIAKKEVDDFQFVLDEEKLRAENRIADLQKENFTFSDEIGSLKLSGEDAVRQHNDAINKLQEEIYQLNEQYLKANAEAEEYKLQAKNGHQEAEDLQYALNAEKDSMNARIAEIEQQKNAEIESLKAAIGDSEAMKKELVQLKEKEKMFDDAVKRGFEVEEICKELKAKMVNSLKSEIDVLGNEKANLQKAFNDKDDELNQLKSSGEKEKAEMTEQISFLNEQLSKVTLEVEEFKSKADVAKKEAEALSATNEKLNKKITKLYDDLDAADAERKESSELIFDLTTKLSKFTGEEVRGGINMAEVVSPRPLSPDNSFKSANEEPQPSASSVKLDHDEEEKAISPTKSKGTPKRKPSIGARITSPFRRGNKKDESQNTSAAAKKDDNATSCTTQ